MFVLADYTLASAKPKLKPYRFIYGTDGQQMSVDTDPKLLLDKLSLYTSGAASASFVNFLKTLLQSKNFNFFLWITIYYLYINIQNTTHFIYVGALFCLHLISARAFKDFH